MLLRWKESIDASINASKLSATNPLTQILKNTEEIRARLKTTKANPTWSQIAALPTQIQGATERKPSQQTEQKRKELKVTIRDDKEREETKRKDIRRLVIVIKESEP